jgi:hypothetical protein
MKLRKSACGFKPSVYAKHQSIEGTWNFDKSAFNSNGQLQELTSVNSTRPSGQSQYKLFKKLVSMQACFMSHVKSFLEKYSAYYLYFCIVLASWHIYLIRHSKPHIAKRSVLLGVKGSILCPIFNMVSYY